MFVVSDDAKQIFSLQREAIITKNDVWSSTDGITWTLVTAGCRFSQKELVFSGNPADGKFGDASQKCSRNSDCYGAEYCDHVLNACVCPMWSPREQHAVAVSGDFIYVSGGYVSVQTARCGGFMCGDTDASSKRYYMSDLWRSRDGVMWEMMNPEVFVAPNPIWGRNNGPDDTLLAAGRGGHQMLIFPYPEQEGEPYIWMFGGRGNDNTPNAPEIYYNDVWVAPISNLSHFMPLHQPGSVYPRTNQSDLSFVPAESLFQSIPWRGRTGMSHFRCGLVFGFIVGLQVIRWHFCPYRQSTRSLVCCTCMEVTFLTTMALFWMTAGRGDSILMVISILYE